MQSNRLDVGRSLATAVIGATLIVAACASGAPGLASPSTGASVATFAAPASATSAAQVCPNPNGEDCLGPLAAGTYTTTHFQPRLTYSVPSGWDNEEDLRGNFLLLPPGGTLAGGDAGTSDYLGVYTQVAPDPACLTTSGPANLDPQAIVACFASRNSLVTTKPQSVTIGGLTGYVLDLKVAAGRGAGALLMGLQPSGFEHSIGPGLTIRLYLLGLRGGSLGIEVDDLGPVDLAAYSKVVETFRFG